MANVTMINVKTATGEVVSPEDIKTFFLLNEQIKDMKKKADALKDKIKGAMELNDIDSIDAGEYTALLTSKTTKTVNDEMLIQVLANHKLQSATEIKIVPVQSKVLEAIAEGKLTQVEYDLCQDSKYTQAFSVKESVKVKSKK